MKREASGWAGRVGQRTSVGRSAIGMMGFGLLIAMSLASGGCQHSLFKRGVQRSQYETYETMRNQHAPDYLEDEFGRERVNLRGRLLTQE